MPQKRSSNAAAKNRKNAKGAARKGRAQAARKPLLDEAARRDLMGVVLAAVAVAMLIALVAPTGATVTHDTALALTLCFGVGAVLCPVALFVFALTFFASAGDRPGSKRVAVGLFLIVLAVLSMISLNVPGASAYPDMVLQRGTVEQAGGYVGGLVAWGLLLLFGPYVGNALLVALIVVGVVLCGFSISGFVARAHSGLEEVHERRTTAREERAAARAAERERLEQERAQQAADAEDSEPTTFIGSRTTSVLKRRPKAPAQDDGGEAATAGSDSVKTQLLKRKRHPDLDVDKARPAGSGDSQPQGEDEGSRAPKEAKVTPQVEPEGSPKSEGRTRLLSRRGLRKERPSTPAGDAGGSDSPSDSRPSKRAGSGRSSAKADGPRTISMAEANATPSDSIAIPDFLANAASGKAGRRPSSRGEAASKASAPRRASKGPGGAVRPGDGDEDFRLPPLSMLSSNPNSGGSSSSTAELEETKRDLQQTLEEFGLRSKVVDYVSGPLVTTFRIEMGEGERVSKIRNLEDDIALTLAAEKVRIFAPIPGTSYVGIEIPNKTRENVHLGDVLPYAKGGPLQVAIGRDSAGKPVIADIAQMPHMLVAGTTGSGKSVMINSMIMSILMRATPKQVRLILIDPKRVEFPQYNGVPHLYVPVVTEPRQAASALQWTVSEMERRLKVFERAGARDIRVYNRMCTSGKLAEMDNPPEPMPYIVVVIDELSDLMMVAGKDVEASIVRIAQLARAAGIHLIIATQRPSTNVVTGLIKSNIDTRAALKVSSGIDSRVILDETGAERLLGNGDMLFKNRGLTAKRVLGCYTSDSEINSVVDFIRSQGEPDYHEEILTAVVPGQTGGGHGDVGDDDDPLVWEAAQIVVESQLGSTSGLQRRLKVGYARAGRIMDMLEAKGVVGPPDGSKPREVLLDEDGLEELRTQEARYREV